jgi:hypothetical protein
MGDANEATESAERTWSISAWCVVAAFGTYFCMYAFRKPFTAAGFADVTAWGLAYKPLLVIAQVLGYTLSKFLGIKVVSEAPPHRRAALLIGLIGAAQIALVLFGLTPAPWNMLWLFLNGLPLGMVFGLVIGFLEGRRQTEALTAGLCTSFIVADGATKSVGAWLLTVGISEFWMPATTGFLFAAPLLLFTWMLSRIPRPNAQDVAARSERGPMDRADRGAFFWRYATGLTLLVLVYLLVTILRSVRADFAPEIWRGLLSTSAAPEIFALSETVVALGVLLLTGSMVLIRDNRRAFFTGLGLAAGGIALVLVSLAGLEFSAFSPFAFMVAYGIGLYLPYIAVHTTIFERLIAMTRDRGTIGYLMYLADSFGYLGYVAVLIARTAGAGMDDFLGFFLKLSWMIALACLVLLVPCWRYFARHPATKRGVITAVKGGT